MLLEIKLLITLLILFHSPRRLWINFLDLKSLIYSLSIIEDFDSDGDIVFWVGNSEFIWVIIGENCTLFYYFSEFYFNFWEGIIINILFYGSELLKVLAGLILSILSSHLGDFSTLGAVCILGARGCKVAKFVSCSQPIVFLWGLWKWLVEVICIFGGFSRSIIVSLGE